MKRFFITLVLLLAAGTALFYGGWAQREVPAGSWGVLRSKTHGVDPAVIREGRIRWVWYKLIPGNTDTAAFTLTERTLPLEIGGILPSGDVYTALAGLKTDFSYRFSVSLVWRLQGESLPALAEREGILSQEDLDRYLSRLSAEIENHARPLLWSYGENEQFLTESRETGRPGVLEKDLAGAFPAVEFLSVEVKTLRYPDFTLYEAVRALYREYLAVQRNELRDQSGRFALENIERRRRLDELTSYGELLTKYPVLIDYLALEKDAPKIP